MLDWFLRPEFLAVAAALISVPIIIHLINRMRYKRIRWAAMEFLLKAQKRNRRRLIIEQLLLLALRCLLVALTGFLVLRFVGFDFSDFASKHALHLVLLDDTLSMSDTWKDADGKPRTSFDVAKKDVIEDKIVKALAKANASDKLIVMPLSKALDPDYAPKIYSRLNTTDKLKEFEADLAAMNPTMMHASVQQAIKRVQQIIGDEQNARVTLHVVSDFRQRDWAQSEAKALHDLFKTMAKNPDFKARLIDVAYPMWTKGQADPLSQDNVGILDFRAGTKVAGKSMPVSFTATIANFSGREAEVRLAVYDKSGAEHLDINFSPLMPLKISPLSTAVVNFEMRFNPTIKAGEAYFEDIVIRLKSPTLGDLENDGLEADNVRHAAVEIREKVPILVVDGDGARSRTDTEKDSFFVNTALMSTSGNSFELFWGDELGGGVATKALERSDLAKFPSIFMLNVRELTPKQLANLETYVRDGGGVCFFMGPQVSPKYYNEKLYKNGDGLFPAPLSDTYSPPPSDEPRKGDFTGQPQVLLREEQFAGDAQFPIFGDIFKKDSKQREVLKDLPIHRYFKVPRSKWKSEPGRVFEIATLPNETPITNYQGATMELMRDRLDRVLDAKEYEKYRSAIDRHRRTLETLVAPGSDKPAYELAPAIEALLNDKSDPNNLKDRPSLAEFWASADPKITYVRNILGKIRDEVRFGDPLVVAGNFGKGRVVAVMTTAGKEWNQWAGGSLATLIYQPFIQETQAYVSSQSSEENRTVGAVERLTFDADAFPGKQLTAKRVYYKALADKPAVPFDLGETFPETIKDQFVFSFPKTELPGLYVTTVRDGRGVVATHGRAYNVDTLREGSLERVNRAEIESNVIGGDFKDKIQFEGPTISDDSLVTRMTDSSESTWLFLLFLFVLVVEQALAVHLSFHLRGNENEALARVTRGS